MTSAEKQFAIEAGAAVARYRDAIESATTDTTLLRGKIRLTAPLLFGRKHVSPLLADFLKTNMLLAVELDLSDRVLDLHHENFDLAVRIGEVRDVSLISRKIGEMTTVVVASPKYIATQGTPLELTDLSTHQIIQHSGLGLNAPWSMRDHDGEKVAVSVSARFSVNQADAAINAALSGNGLVRALSYQVAHHLQEGDLVRILQPFEPLPLPVSIVRPESRRGVRRARALVDYLSDHLSSLTTLKSQKQNGAQ